MILYWGGNMLDIYEKFIMSMDIHGGWVLKKSPFIWAYLNYSTVFNIKDCYFFLWK